MKICYRDELGLVVREIDLANTTGISFDGMYAYFNDPEGTDYRISTKDIVLIGEMDDEPDEEPDPRMELVWQRERYLQKQCAPAPFVPHAHY